MTEQEFTNKFIQATIRKDQNKMKRLCKKACSQWSEDKASELANDCYEAIAETDSLLGKWLDNWFNMGCWY